MTRFFQCAFMLIIVFLFNVAHAITLTDIRGHELTLAHSPLRIVSLAPNITEILFAIGAGDRVVGADEYSNYPEAAAQIPRIGNSARIDIERVIALKADLVIGWLSGNAPNDIAKLEQLGAHVYITEFSTLDNIADQFITLGKLTGNFDKAVELAAGFRRRLAELQKEYAGKMPVSVFYQVWDRPLMTVNGRHFISDAIHLCGGNSLFRELEPLAPTISKEAVIAANPQVIISGRANSHGATLKEMWGEWKTLDAVKYGNLFVIPADLVARPTPRILEGVTMICEKLERARVKLDEQ
jgi:iron complex transport system substrate-binding protein